MRRLLIAGGYAIVVGVVLRILLPIPVITTAAVLMFFFLLQIIEARFGTGLAIGERWFRMGIKTLVAFVAFVALRFLTGQVLGIYPVAARNVWGPNGGAAGLFWGNQSHPVIVHELVIVMIIGWILWGCTRGQRMAKFAAFVLAVGIFLGVLFPMWAGSWPKSREAIDKSLATNGVAGTMPRPVLGMAGVSYPAYNPDPLAIAAGLYTADAAGTNNHEAQDMDHFDLVLTGDGEFGKEGHVRPPRGWTDWKVYWVSTEPDRHVGFIYSGSVRSIGPFGANLPPIDDPRFNNITREWLTQGKGVLRYQRIR